MSDQGEPHSRFLEYVELSAEERAAQPRPVMNLVWHDPSAIRRIPAQSWFNRLRSEVNRGATVKFSVGVFTLEQAATQDSQSEESTVAIAKELFEKAALTSVEEFAGKVKADIQKASGGFYEPSLVVVDGHCIVPYSFRYVVDTYFSLIARRLGYGLTGSVASDVLVSPDIVAILNSAQQLVSILLPEETVQGCLKADAGVDKSYMYLAPPNSALVKAMMLGSREAGRSAEFVLGMPPEAVERIEPGGGIYARVLGWASQMDGAIGVRAIAIASVDAYMQRRRSQQSLDEE